jgi:hypothetical protein
MNLFKKTPAPYSNRDILEACTQTGCPVCRVGAHSVKRYLKSIFYEYVNDIDTRARLNKRLGVCEEHVQLLLNTRIADTLGASIIYENIVKVLLREFPNSSSPMISNPKEAARLISGFTNSAKSNGTCLACEQRDAIIKHTLDEMSKALSDENLQAALQGSDGLCFPHLAQLLERLEKPEDVAFLMDITCKKLEFRQSEMAMVIRKNDYQSDTEKITHEEAIAWKKSMCMVSGVSISPTGDKHD